MSAKPGTDIGINSWLEDELYQQYLHDRSAVDESWKQVFGNGGKAETEAPALSRSSLQGKRLWSGPLA